jgi:UDP-N-acetylglucosamine acyltransferase
LNTLQAVERIEGGFPAGEDRDELLAFIRASKRGLIKKTGEEWENASD